MLHLAWCLADSAATNRWSTGSQTMLCGSCFIQPRKCNASIRSFRLEEEEAEAEAAALSKQDLTEGSTLLPPKAATSPRTLLSGGNAFKGILL